MSLNGKLEDVSLSDVMQFIHLGRRTGTLTLRRGERRAEIGFHRGQIVSASAPGAKRLGELLIDGGLLSPEALADAVAAQGREQPRQSLGQLLIRDGILDFEDIRKAIERQIEETVYELVTWTSGSFEFALDELKPIDDIAMYPGDLIPKLDLNTQMVLLEATRIFDERNRRDRDRRRAGHDDPDAAGGDRGAGDRAGPDEGEDGGDDGSSPDLRSRIRARPFAAGADGLEGLELGAEDEDDGDELDGEPLRRLQIVSPESRLAVRMEELIPPERARVVRVPLREAGTRLPGEPSPTIVVLDLRDDAHGAEDLRAIRRSRPSSSVIALVDSPDNTRDAFEAGAVAAIPADPEALAACFGSLVRTLEQARARPEGGSSVRAGFARLRRILADIRSGLMSATMALNLMHIISESVERAVLFLVHKDRLSALGAFGYGASGEALADETRDLVLSLEPDNVLTRAIGDGQPRSLSFEEAELPDDFAALIGRPRSGQVVVFPVLGAERVISVVYTDNGSSSRAIEDIELLELATAQVGVAFENELLRRQIEHRRP